MMKRNTITTFILSALLFISCSDDSLDSTKDSMEESYADSSTASDSSRSEGGNQGGEAGIITAGEWNDLVEWDFWKDLINGQEYSQKSSYWEFYTEHRISVSVLNGTTPVNNAKVTLLANGEIVWTAKTDNFGKAELFVNLYQKEEQVDLSNYSLEINDMSVVQSLTSYQNGVNEIQYNGLNTLNNIELCFIVDATGSMGDELNFLKQDLESVINQVENNNTNLDIATSSVFYRDENDNYLVKEHDFTNNLDSTIDFIQDQSASGGGDFPEAVHTALISGIENLQWSENAKARIAFLLLDAPPHYETQVVDQIQNSIKIAAEKGIKIIPVTASGIDKETEFLMRFMAIATNGTYVFITNDSGVGNDHLEPTVGDYQVEQLNDLLVRLIQKYAN